jgi:hypothetical protein
MSISDIEIREKIIQIATSIASSMGLDSHLFEEQFAYEIRHSILALAQVSFPYTSEISKSLSLPGKDSVPISLLHSGSNAKHRHTYTLEFLRALTEKPVEGDVSITNVGNISNIPKVGTENPRHNSSPYPAAHNTHTLHNAHAMHNTHSMHNPHNAYITHPYNTKGKYKPRGIDVENTKENTAVSRDIVRSHITSTSAISASTPNTPSTPSTSRGENAWVPTKSKKAEDDPIKIKLNKIRSDLNKISPDNEEIISDRIREELVEECITEIIPTFFDKGVWEQKYREIYARLCVKLNAKYPTVFIPALLKHCQHEFEVKVSEDDEEEDVMQVMKRRIGAIYFIVEMLKVKLIKPDIILLCIDKILKPTENSEKCEQDVCHVSELIIIATPIIKNKVVLNKLRPTIDTIKNLHEHQFLSQRSKFKIEDAVKMYNTYSK